MKIVFIGMVDFSKNAFQKFIELNAQVSGVHTKKKFEFNSDFADLRPLREKSKIHIKLVDYINSKDNYYWIKYFNPDIIKNFMPLKQVLWKI